MSKVKTGFFQELQADGSVANSFIRLLEFFFFGLLSAYTFFSFVAYQSNLAQYVKLLEEKVISEQTFNVFIIQTKRIDWDIFLVLVVATVAPKVIQKFAEAKGGIKDITETTTSTKSSDQTVKTTT